MIAIYFLSVTMGISILAGVGILVLLIPINLLVTRQARKQQVDITDIYQEYSVRLTLFCVDAACSPEATRCKVVQTKVRNDERSLADLSPALRNVDQV